MSSFLSDRDLVLLPGFSVVHESGDGPSVLFHRVTLAEALAHVSQLAPLNALPIVLEGLSSLAVPGVVVFHQSKLGKYRTPRGVTGLEHEAYRKRAVLTWGCAPPLHETVYAIVWDLRDADVGGSDADTATVLPTLSDDLIREVGALIPKAERAFDLPRSRSAPASEITFDRLLRLRELLGWRVARDLGIAMGKLVRGLGHERQATLSFDEGGALDDLLTLLDHMSPTPRYTRHDFVGTLVFAVRGEAGGTTFRMQLADHPLLSCLAARVEADSAHELAVVIEALSNYLPVASKPLPTSTAPREWMRWVVATGHWPDENKDRESFLGRGLQAPSVEERRSAMEASVLFASPLIRQRLAARSTGEPDSQLRGDMELLTLLLRDRDAAAPATLATVLRMLDANQPARRREGLELAATLGTLDPRGEAELSESLWSLVRSDKERDFRFVGRALLAFR